MPHGYVTKNFVRLDEAYRKGYTTASLQGSSRCFGAGTLIRMADGRLKPVEAIRIGDKVMSADGNGYNTVVEIDSGIDTLYKIHQSKGIDFITNGEHLLPMKQTRAKNHKVAIPGFKSAEKRRVKMLPYDRTKVHTFPVEWFAKQSRNFQLRHSCYKQTLCQLEEKELPIDPYYLGAWLGDGCSTRCNEFTNVDKELIDWFAEFVASLGGEAYRVDKVTSRFKVSIHSNGAGFKTPEIEAFVKAFRSLNLIKNKYIPDIYLYNSVENRLKLLAGLIDTDGYKTSRNTYCITQTNRKIIEGVEEICHITGFYTNGIRTEKATMRRKDGSIYETTVYAVEINHSDFRELNKYIKLPRKHIEKQCDRDYFCTSITIEEIGLGEYFGFSLDNSPYFLLSDGTVQHNSSKTYSNVQWLIRMCYDVPGTTVSIVRKTMPALKRSVYRDFKDIMIDWGLWNERQMNKTEFIYTFGNGSWIEFFSCEDEQKLRGSKRQILFVNEANEISFLEWQQLQMRTTKFSIIDYNPSFSEEHWINQVNLEKRTCFWISTYKDNPFLEQKVIDEIESLQWKNKSLWQVYGLGLRAIVEGLIFPNIEIVDEIPYQALKNRYVGMDFGYAADPTAIVEVSIYRNTIYINELCYQTHMLTSDIIRELKAIDWQPEIISESADPRLVDEISNAGIDINAVHKYAGSINAGLMKMKEYNICITRKSTNVIKEFRNYTYRQDKEGKWLNEPIDAFNHCFVGETLVATNKGEKRIDTLKVGDMVRTSRGNHKISKIFDNGRQKTLRVRFYFINFTLEIEATPNHLFKTKEGWKRLEKLTKGDILYLNKSSMEKCIVGTKERDISVEEQNGYTGLCGNITTGRYQKVTTFTIKTEIPKTILLKIWNCIKGKNTLVYTHRSTYNPRSIYRKLVTIWQKLPKLLKNGIIQNWVENGIKSKQKKQYALFNQKNLYANNVVSISSPNLLGTIDSVQTIVSPSGVEKTTSTMKSEPVSNVEKSLLSTNTAECNSVVEVVLEDIIVLEENYNNVYDIEVEEAHEFFANGVLVHNCIDSIRYVVLEKVLGGYGSGMSASEILGIVG